MSAVLLCAVLCVFSMIFIDRPVEVFVAAHTGWRRLFQAASAPSLLPVPFACIYLAVCTFKKSVRALPGAGLWLRVSLATIAAVAAKDELKWMFGRPWPQNWMKYGIYAFHPFDTSFLFGSFPSGHTAYIAAPMLVLWWMMPRWRIVWAGMILLVMAGLIGAGYHFVADVIGGFFVGLAAAAGTLLWLGMRDA